MIISAMPHRPTPHKGRGALTNPSSRFAAWESWEFDDGWGNLEEETAPPATTLHNDPARTVISYNQSPDLGFSAAVNPYKGCSHGCIYCYARPSHEYLGLSAGLDFEIQIFYKANAAERFAAELRAPGYQCQPIVFGANTDPYQPDEKHLRITRALLQVAAQYNQPVRLITKGSLITRDLDLLAGMARRNQASVSISITSLSSTVKRALEPRTAGPAARLKVIAELAAAGIPVGVMVAPVIPAITDHELETILARAAAAGAERAGYVVLRLPHGVKDLFRDWLEQHYPQRAAHVMSLVQQLHGGRDYNPAWGARMTGSGVFANLLAQRFTLACRRLGLEHHVYKKLDCTQFAPPPQPGTQGVLDL